ncbi:alpha-keto acid decarboxylase family protein [Staphylococcus warneri]|uniref:alpha-keto acid decarboxylase family protein n=1 Tax=Staphylococcus warneri TaxID=1292 RepID=UPI001FB2F4F1|nr:alpha-keto acid decarboxylase family protein [Staphylococcus warneri]MCJ1787313.1 alpha-keto acid decarboxylase family protein [Staphylococcus warneri]MCJ1789875.1 alpha-keto acid decarboxylase family protein [Staphylococcus warneri]MCJ1792273.1 alpha-keto acid decarboxylase family protein [Staphylococcus warneri]MCJ1794692.1 alpha-keto acid decarboxylase family protein [Staphylococcus warneri]MCJ1797102.1 alpha-keto acid decarboxylase family protein [Staphylococcus warneri]
MKQRVGQYLMDAVNAAGVDKIFGVPGDFNLAFLDDIISHDQVEWIGNTNELNASYAADGYARINGLGALVTTFGVGELSAVNGIAGSYAERVPVIAITGAPTRAVESAGKYVHHSLGEGTFDDYRKMFEPITTAQGYITPENATTEIPRLIQAAINERRPVHLHLPIDVAMTEIDVSKSFQPEARDDQDVSHYIQMIEDKLNSAKQPVIITGHEINSFGLHSELEQFVNQTHIPVAQLSLGKGAFNEENEHYLGIFDGSIAEENVKNYVNQSDAILNIGSKLTDSATAGFSFEFDIDDVVMINHNYFKMNETISEQVALPHLIKGLMSISYKNKSEFPMYQRPKEHDYQVDHEPLTQATYFKMMQDFLQLDDILIAEQGSSFFGAYDLALYKDNTFIGQPLWGSIGYTLPATLGTQIAAPHRRNVLLIGDGSLQLTVQSLSTMIRQQLKPIIFVVNNDGYTVERLIHGMKEPYNDIHMWDYKTLPAVFGGDNVVVHDVNTSHELKETFEKINAHSDCMHFVEVKMAIEDAPAKLSDIAKAFASQNK